MIKKRKAPSGININHVVNDLGLDCTGALTEPIVNVEKESWKKTANNKFSKSKPYQPRLEENLFKQISRISYKELKYLYFTYPTLFQGEPADIIQRAIIFNRYPEVLDNVDKLDSNILSSSTNICEFINYFEGTKQDLKLAFRKSSNLQIKFGFNNSSSSEQQLPKKLNSLISRKELSSMQLLTGKAYISTALDVATATYINNELPLEISNYLICVNSKSENMELVSLGEFETDNLPNFVDHNININMKPLECGA